MVALEWANISPVDEYIWVRSRRWGCLVTWFCYQMIAKPGNKTAAPLWPDPYIDTFLSQHPRGLFQWYMYKDHLERYRDSHYKDKTVFRRSYFHNGHSYTSKTASLYCSASLAHMCVFQYLGTDLEEVRGRTVHEDDACLTLPILTLPGVVLTPGQTLPLHLFQSTTVAMIRRLLEGDKTFGLITSRSVYKPHAVFRPSVKGICLMYQRLDKMEDILWTTF